MRRRGFLAGLLAAPVATAVAAPLTAKAAVTPVVPGLASAPYVVPRFDPDGNDIYTVIADGTGRHTFIPVNEYPMRNDVVPAPPGGWAAFMYATAFNGKTISLYGWAQDGEIYTTDYIVGQGWTVPDLLQPNTISGG